MKTKQTAVEYLLKKWFSNNRLLFYTDFEKAIKIEEKQIYDADTIQNKAKKEKKRKEDFSKWFSEMWDISMKNHPDHAEDWNSY
jgi:hypothetical protein